MRVYCLVIFLIALLTNIVRGEEGYSWVGLKAECLAAVDGDQESQRRCGEYVEATLKDQKVVSTLFDSASKELKVEKERGDVITALRYLSDFHYPLYVGKLIQSLRDSSLLMSDRIELFRSSIRMNPEHNEKHFADALHALVAETKPCDYMETAEFMLLYFMHKGSEPRLKKQVHDYLLSADVADRSRVLDLACYGTSVAVGNLLYMAKDYGVLSDQEFALLGLDALYCQKDTLTSGLHRPLIDRIGEYRGEFSPDQVERYQELVNILSGIEDGLEKCRNYLRRESVNEEADSGDLAAFSYVLSNGERYPVMLFSFDGAITGKFFARKDEFNIHLYDRSNLLRVIQAQSNMRSSKDWQCFADDNRCDIILKYIENESVFEAIQSKPQEHTVSAFIFFVFQDKEYAVTSLKMNGWIRGRFQIMRDKLEVFPADFGFQAYMLSDEGHWRYISDDPFRFASKIFADQSTAGYEMLFLISSILQNSNIRTILQKLIETGKCQEIAERRLYADQEWELVLKQWRKTVADHKRVENH